MKTKFGELSGCAEKADIKEPEWTFRFLSQVSSRRAKGVNLRWKLERGLGNFDVCDRNFERGDENSGRMVEGSVRRLDADGMPVGRWDADGEGRRGVDVDSWTLG